MKEDNLGQKEIDDIELEELNTLLRKEIEHKFGQKVISNYSCELLEKKILENTGERISSQSLRRYFGLIKYKSDLGAALKNILSVYVGCKDFDDFKNKANRIKNKVDYDWSAVKCFYNDKINENLVDDVAYCYDKMAISFASFILSNKDVFESFTDEMHKSPIALKYVISYHPMYDNLAHDWYLRGVSLFVKNSKVFHIKVFGECLKAMHFVFTQDYKKLNESVNLLLSMRKKLRNLYGIIWALEARIIAVMMINAKNNQDVETLESLKNECLNLLAKNKQHINGLEIKDDYRFFVLIVSDLLNYNGLSDFAEKLQYGYPLDNMLTTEARKDGYHNAALIVEASSLMLNNKIDEAKKLVAGVELDDLLFDFRDYFKIQYYILKLNFTSRNAHRKRKELQFQIDSLVNRTELSFYRKFYQS